MTDREMLLKLCERLGLQRVDDPDKVRGAVWGGAEKCFSTDDRSVVMGSGEDGYGGFYVEFEFDAEGNAISHTVKE